jgi:NADH-quinone oxidoreductase subunit E
MGTAEAQNRNSPEDQQKSRRSKGDILLKELELLEEHYSLGGDKPPLSPTLQALEKQSLRDAQEMEQVTEEKEVIGRLVDELRVINTILDKHDYDKSNLIQILLDLQTQLHWLPKPTLKWISERLDVPLAQIYNIATFYKAFSLTPQGRHTIQVCLGTSCHVQGGTKLRDMVEQVLSIKSGETTSDQKFTLHTVNCLGCCALAPVMVVDDDYHSKLSLGKVSEVLSKYD